MPTQSDSLPIDLNAQETPLGAELTILQAPVRREWETPALRSMSTDETESGFIFATREETTIPTRPLVS
jgi:hypothetical protein